MLIHHNRYIGAKALIVVALLSLVACATAPTQEMSDARQAVQAAKEAGARQHVPELLKSAEQQLEQAGVGLHQHDYRTARKEALAARTHAFDAQEMALALAAAVKAADQARAIGVLSAETDVLLQQARQAASEGDVQVTVRLANEARNMAEQDLRLAK